jgi:hypothetical protein
MGYRFEIEVEMVSREQYQTYDSYYSPLEGAGGGMKRNILPDPIVYRPSSLNHHTQFSRSIYDAAGIRCNFRPYKRDMISNAKYLSTSRLRSSSLL